MGLTVGQRKCVETLDVPLVVAAGAGSGKTFTLTKRIVGALQSGAVGDIGEVCAITFTKKAAAELKSRLKGELRACGLVEQALKVDEAWVSTIHGMCARVLRAHAIELGIDPAFEVIEEARAGDLLSRAVDAVLVRAQLDGASGDGWAERIDALFGEYRVRSGAGFGASVESMLAELVGAASAQAGGIGSFVLPGVTAAPQVVVEQAVGIVDDVLAAAAGEKESPKRDEWAAHASRLVDDARAALGRGVGSYEEALALIAPFKLAKTFGGKEFKARVDEARAVLGAFVMEARLGAAGAHLETLVELARRALDEYARLKRADGVLDNNDLLVLASRAIEEHPSIAERYADKFKLLMVDEFQDTDQMQVDMIRRLAGGGARRLCVVGDAQQSIYRFRGADVSVYRRHLNAVRAEWGEESIIELSENFRSHADVLSFVDRVFERPGMFGGEFMSLAAGRDEGKVAAPFGALRPRIVVQHTTCPWRGVEAATVTEAAARRIAREFAELARAGHSAGEMVVLLGRMTNAGVYAQALRDEGLSCVISGGSVFAGSLEAQIVRELAHVLANPHETRSLFNVLTGPLFGLTAGDLLEVGGIGGFWAAASGNRGGASRVECAFRVMLAAREAVTTEPVSRIIEAVAVGSGWLSRLERRGPEGLAAAGNVFKAIRMVREIERAGAFGPVSVMRRFDEALERSKEAPGALSVSGGNSVRIMTIHASKGLEFPIVAVAEMKEAKAPSSRLLISSVGGRVYLSLDLDGSLDDAGKRLDLDAVRDYVLGEVAGEGDLAAAVMEDAGALHRRLALRDFAAAGDGEEAKRLLYVALTRAKEALVVSVTGKRTKANPTGVPKSAMAGVFDGLDPLGSMIGEGRSLVDFGGSRPAVIERVALAPADEGASADGAGGDRSSGAGGCAASGADGADESFLVPDPADEPAIARESFRPLRDGVFSYSSISDAVHEGDVLDRLADAFAVSVDRAVVGSGEPQVFAALREAALAFADGGGSGDEGPSRAFDEDRATALGTAFHRLAQYAVVSRGADLALARPPESRVDALSRTCGLDDAQRGRLSAALDRWFGCGLAGEMGALPQLAAEVPFFVSAGDAYLEGEIDLLGFDEGRSHAFVVDYKTGGSDGETVGALKRKHVLQAACYAYAILLQGVESIEAVFARVERSCADDPSQPQCVRYRFTEGDLPVLGDAIAEVYASMSARR